MKHIICLIDCQAVFTYNCCETTVMDEPREAAQPSPPEALPCVLLLRPLLFAASKAMGGFTHRNFLSGLQGHRSSLR